jgi:mannose-6-phosphate isomerase-like protein (cupin superfamily)
MFLSGGAMKIKNLKNSNHYSWGEACDGWHMLERDDASVIRERMPPGTAEKMHYHEKSRQFFFILSGTATFSLSPKDLRLSVGDGIEIPPMVSHQIRNEEPTPLEFLLLSYPPTKNDRVNVS